MIVLDDIDGHVVVDATQSRLPCTHHELTEKHAFVFFG